MELSWISKIRITVVMGLGCVVIGLLFWPAISPSDPAGLTTISNLSLFQGVLLLVVSAALGFVSYFLAWPYGCEIGLLAVPAGLALWGLRSGSVAQTLAVVAEPQARMELFHTMRFESLLWLVVVYAGWSGVQLAKKVRPNPMLPILKMVPKPGLVPKIHYGLACLVGLVVAQFLISVFAQDIPVRGFMTQPPVSQLFFGVFMAFAVAAFLVEHFLKLNYHWIMPALAFIYVFNDLAFVNDKHFTVLAEAAPNLCLPNSGLFALPIQIVSFGFIGALVGYWTSIRYHYWRTHELG